MLSSVKCPSCGGKETMVVEQHKFSFRLYCFSCGKTRPVQKKAKLRIYQSRPELLESEVW